MRFLIVHKNYASEAKDLVAESGVVEIEVILMRGESTPVEGVIDLLARSEAPSVALVSVNRKYVKALAEICDVQVERSVATIKGAHEELLQWLRGTTTSSLVPELPSKLFLAAANVEPKLVIAHNALIHADEIAQNRYAFANRAAAALGEYASRGEAPGGLDLFFQAKKLHFAPNGQVTATLTISQSGKKDVTHCTQWHLKEGDGTTREGAARIYFCPFAVGGLTRVFVLFCGPHPTKSFKVSASISAV